MSKRTDRAANGPSWSEVILGAVLSLVLGVVLGAVLLILRPAAAVKELPKEADRDRRTVYFVEGSRDMSKAQQALAKRKAFAEGQSISLAEDELNALAAAPAAAPATPAPAAPKPADKAKPADKPAGGASAEMLATGAPNFRIRDGGLQVAVPVTLNALGLGQKVIVQARGAFVKNGDMFVFEPSEFYLGSCPVQGLPFLSDYVRNKFISAQPIPEDIKASWTKLANVSIEGNVLKLTMP